MIGALVLGGVNGFLGVYVFYKMDFGSFGFDFTLFKPFRFRFVRVDFNGYYLILIYFDDSSYGDFTNYILIYFLKCLVS